MPLLAAWSMQRQDIGNEIEFRHVKESIYPAACPILVALGPQFLALVSAS